MAERLQPRFFQASAKLQRVLGRDLMPDDYSAFEELVKNAYDSNASRVEIEIRQSPSPIIIIRDDGTGLDLEDFERLWMRAGYSEKSSKPLPGTGRIQAGEKGVGRFAAGRLGNLLTLLTKTAAMTRALEAVFDWTKFEAQSKLLSDIPIPVSWVPAIPFEGTKSGTILRIEGLRSEWTKDRIHDLRARLGRLLSPFRSKDDFSILLTAKEFDVSGSVFAQAAREADFEWDIQRDSESYKIKVRRKEISAMTGEPVYTDWRIIDEGQVSLDANADFGPVRARLFYYTGRTRKADVGEAAPGIAVFRDGLRVEPAGHDSADWLGLVKRRAVQAGHALVPSRLFGYVDISRIHNPQLVDAANRRSFIRGPAYESFATFLQTRVLKLEAQVEEEFSKPKWKEKRERRASEVAQAGRFTLSRLSIGLAHELRQALQITQSATDTLEALLPTVGPDAVEAASQIGAIRSCVARMDKHIRFLKDLGQGRAEIDDFLIDDLIEEVRSHFSARTRGTAISIERKGDSGVKARTSRWTILMALTNLVLNAIEAIGSHSPPKEPHKIQLSVHNTKKEVRLVVRDDGPGIPEAARKLLFKKTMTTKKEGFGVALIVWREHLKEFGADMGCESFVKPTEFVITIPKTSHGNHFAR